MTEEILLEEFEDTGKPTEKRPEPKSYNFKEIDREDLQTKLKDIVTISPLPTSVNFSIAITLDEMSVV